MRKEFTEKELTGFLVRLGSRMSRPVTAYMLGGGAMALRNQKTATKDLDLVFLNQKDCTAFASKLPSLGFAQKPTKSLEPEYAEMEAEGIWVDAFGFRLDLFVKTVCRKLELSKAMVSRSFIFKNFGLLEVRLVSNEDIVLFKSITDRDRDLDDMAAVIRSSGVDWNVVLAECRSQSGKRPWHGAVFSKFSELKETHGIDAPILGPLEKLAEKDAVKAGFELRLQKGLTRNQALEELRKMGFTKKELEGL